MGLSARWARVVAVFASMATSLYLLAVLGFGALWVSTDFSALACFDGTEPGCDDLDATESGLAAVRTDSWALAAASVGALIACWCIALKMRRAPFVVAVLMLCAMVVGAMRILTVRAGL